MHPSPNDIWFYGSGANLVQWDGATLRVHSPSAGLNIAAMKANSPTEVYAAAGNATTRAVMHWDGATWRTIALPTMEFVSSIDATSPSNIWLSLRGSSSLAPLRWNGTSWSPVAAPPAEHTGGELVLISPDEALVLSGPRVFRLRSGVWSRERVGHTVPERLIYANRTLWLAGDDSLVFRR
jgi:hypothetical protein